jgi:hypothetical protein
LALEALESLPIFGKSYADLATRVPTVQHTLEMSFAGRRLKVWAFSLSAGGTFPTVAPDFKL